MLHGDHVVRVSCCRRVIAIFCKKSMFLEQEGRLYSSLQTQTVALYFSRNSSIDLLFQVFTRDKTFSSLLCQLLLSTSSKFHQFHATHFTLTLLTFFRRRKKSLSRVKIKQSEAREWSRVWLRNEAEETN